MSTKQPVSFTVKFSRRRIGNKMLKKIKVVSVNALEKTGIQMLDWYNNGSPVNPAKPPIRWGVLRASSSVFVGPNLIAMNDKQVVSKGEANPAISNEVSGPFTVRLVWNTKYATEMHEGTYNLGAFSRAQAGSGRKWAESHSRSDGPLIGKTIAKFMKKEL